MTNIKFCVLSYYPSILNDENINVGLLFLNVDTKERSFYTLRNTKRLASFDDEIDMDFMMTYLKGVKEDWEGDLFCPSRDEDVESFIYNFGNELRFGRIQSSMVEDSKAFIEDTKRMVFRFDYEKSERPNEESVKKYIKRFLVSNSIEYSSTMSGGFEEKVNYDFIVNNYGFKSFVVDDGSNVQRQFLNYKGWAYTAKMNEEAKGIKTVFIVDSERFDDNYRTMIRILESSATVMKSSEVFSFIREHASA